MSETTPRNDKVKAQLGVLFFVSSILTSYYEQSSPSTVLKTLKPNRNTRFKSSRNDYNIKLNLKASLHELILQWEHKIGYIKIKHSLTLIHSSRQGTPPPSPFQPIASGIWFGPPTSATLNHLFQYIQSNYFPSEGSMMSQNFDQLKQCYDRWRNYLFHASFAQPSVTL